MIARTFGRATLGLTIFTVEFLVGMSELLERRRERRGA